MRVFEDLDIINSSNISFSDRSDFYYKDKPIPICFCGINREYKKEIIAELEKVLYCNIQIVIDVAPIVCAHYEIIFVLFVSDGDWRHCSPPSSSKT